MEGEEERKDREGGGKVEGRKCRREVGGRKRNMRRVRGKVDVGEREDGYGKKGIHG